LRNEAMRAGVQVYSGIDKVANCHGFGCCGACRVLLAKGMENASPMGWWERTRLKLSMAYIGHEDQMRLSCQTRVNGDLDVVTRPAMNWFGENFFS
jgi:ferredoxin